MSLKQLLRPILDNDNLTRGLGDAEARALVEWLVQRAEECYADNGADAVPHEVARLCRRARAIARFVWLWSYGRAFAAAIQLAATERFTWPLPASPADPYELMADILYWEHQGRYEGTRGRVVTKPVNPKPEYRNPKQIRNPNDRKW
jgi:hypothetical protein